MRQRGFSGLSVLAVRHVVLLVCVVRPVLSLTGNADAGQRRLFVRREEVAVAGAADALVAVENGGSEASVAADRFHRLENPGSNVSHFKERMVALETKAMANITKFVQPGKVKLLIGITTMGYEREFRDSIRDTWLKHPGLCRVNLEHNNTPPENCRIFVTFVMGKNNATDPHVQEEFEKHRDLVQATYPDETSMHDPARRGEVGSGHLSEAQRKKADLWLRFATLHFAWATHVAKADMDTWPNLEKILEDVTDLSKSDWAHEAAKPAGWQEADGIYYGISCGGGLKGFKQGAFYLFTRSFLVCMFSVDVLKYPASDGFDGGADDLMMWSRVHLAMKSENPKQGKCRDPWWVGPGSCGDDARWKHPIS
eukprot:TRINITY_DN75300_c0_g1_i1.p1 TRINITY_DN75300_c0_g1~~TRINITY_DN75300_c0_g1_i1.p1  ORF type:complete len:368 (+),score=87.76 TRINITY_DN75300_c0_g1_i1:123-1226(+)